MICNLHAELFSSLEIPCQLHEKKGNFMLFKFSHYKCFSERLHFFKKLKKQNLLHKKQHYFWIHDHYFSILQIFITCQPLWSKLPIAGCIIQVDHLYQTKTTSVEATYSFYSMHIVLEYIVLIKADGLHSLTFIPSESASPSNSLNIIFPSEISRLF